MCEFIKVCEKAARAGGRVIRERQRDVAAREKAPRDLVTDADLESQRVIFAILRNAYPEHGMLGEEEIGSAHPNRSIHNPAYRWIVDPLDGTSNYVHGMRGYSVSVALEHGGDLVVGAVYDPISEECFVAEAGKGAWLNGNEIHVSNVERLSDALVAASFSANIQVDSDEVRRFLTILPHCQSLRRLGSAALNLAYLAAGRLDAYWATSLNIWDVAAGALLVREAGGILTSIDGSPFVLSRPWLAAAATQALHEEIVQRLQESTRTVAQHEPS